MSHINYDILSLVQSGRSKRVKVDGRAKVIPLVRLLLSLETVQIHFFRSYSLFSLDHQLLVFWTVQFDSWPSSFSHLDRPV